jgi:outer membrane lipoprotein-sorting protein
MKTLITPLLFLLTITATFSQPNSKTILDNMFTSIADVETLRFKLKKEERVSGEMKLGEQDVKFNRSPKKIYTYIHAPNKGVELIWINGHNDNKALINPNGFPYINVNLDPYGSNMRKGNHHTVHEVGFDYIGSILARTYKECNGNPGQVFSYKGDVKFDNKDCYEVHVDYKNFTYAEYTVKAGENLVDIAYRNMISDYMILEKNPQIKSFDGVKGGDKIIIPNAYAKKTILYIDKSTNLPVVQKMFDEKGLYEQYEFYSLVVNKEIPLEEFKSDYKEYNF